MNSESGEFTAKEMETVRLIKKSIDEILDLVGEMRSDVNRLSLTVSMQSNAIGMLAQSRGCFDAHPVNNTVRAYAGNSMTPRKKRTYRYPL
ncbi:hypothetical protein ACFL08_04125 [Patescibacteria group bacterium]